MQQFLLQKYKAVLLMLLLVKITTSFAQVEEPKYVSFGGNYIYSEKTLVLAVRFDKGIDSITFPIDTTLIKTVIKKIDSNGKILSPKKVYYAYYFSPKKDTIYKLPDGKIWFNNKSFDLKLDKTIELKVPKPPKKLSELELIALEKEKEKYKKEEEKKAELKLLTNEITSRISKNVKTQTTLLWTDKKIYKIGDFVRIVIENNYDFFKEDFPISRLSKSIEQHLKLHIKLNKANYENGVKRYYSTIIYKAIAAGKVNLDASKLGVKTNSWSFQILD